MSDLKNSFKLVRYSLVFKESMIMAIIFFLVGTVFEITGDGSSVNFMTGLYYAVPGSVIVNIFILSRVPGLIRSSRLGYYAATKAISLSVLVYSLFAYTVLVVLRLCISIPAAQHRVDEQWELGRFKMLPERLYFDLIKSAFLIAFIIIYSAIAFRHYWLSLCIMIVVIVGLCGLNMIRIGCIEGLEQSVIKKLMAFAGDMFVPLLLGICYGVLVFGAVLFRVINNALIKYEIEPMAYRNALKNAYAKR